MSELPQGWTEAPLEAIVDILDSVRIPLNATEREQRIAGKPAEALFPYYGATGQVGEIDDFLFDEPLILLGEDGVPFLDRFRHKAYLVRGKCWVNNHAHVLRAIEAAVDRRYLAGYLNVFDYTGFVTGSTRLKLTQGAMRSIPVLLAPLPEQRRIADKLDALLPRVDACRERLEGVPTILKRFRDAVLAAATSGELTREWREARGENGEPQSFRLEDAEAIRDYAFPASWSTQRLSDIATIIGGVTKDSKKQSTEFTELPYLRVANVQRGYLDLSEVKTIRVPPDRVDELLLRTGDILFNEGGDIDKLGRGWVWNGELPACVFQNHVFRARLFDPSFEPRFFSWYGNSRGYDYFLARGKQTTNLASINKSVLSALPVVIPPAEEQQEIVRRVHEMFELAERMERNCSTAATRVAAITSSVLAKAFRGELVPQDPKDESASELLARIKSHREAPIESEKPKRGVTRSPLTRVEAETNMFKRKDVARTHLTAILKERGALTAEALWNASQLEIDDFYDQLKAEEAEGLLREKRGDTTDAPRLLEPAA